MSSTSKPSKRLTEALAVAWELAGNPKLSDAGARVVLAELARYPEAAVLVAIDRAMREVTGRLSLAAIIERIDDGRPSADEAWAQVGTTDEGETIVCTTEALEARGACGHLLEEDPIAARMAFKDRYKAIVTERRAAGVPVQWVASLGHDRGRRQGVLARAVQEGRLTATYAAGLLDVTPDELMGKARPALSPAAPRPVAQLVGQVAKSSGPPPRGPGCLGWTHEDGTRCPQWSF